MLDITIQKEFVSEVAGVTFSLDASFTAGQEIMVLFGPSGAGKTTILRAIAGILTPDAGRISVNGNIYFDSRQGIDLSIQERRVGFVFQDYLLFPHLTAEQNVAFGVRDGSEKSRRRRAGEMLSLLGINYAAERRPHELSGGEQQRVALARALGSEPAILLLDEPLSAVDAPTRSRLLGELGEIQRRSRVPFLYVTHSPADAVRAGDTALVLEGGRIVQQGKPAEVFNSPRDLSAARAVGPDNILQARVLEQFPTEGITIVSASGCRLALTFRALPLGAIVTVAIPSEDIIVSRDPISQTSARNLLPGTVRYVIRDEPTVELVIDCGVDLKVRVTTQAAAALGISPGLTVYLLFKANACRVLN